MIEQWKRVQQILKENDGSLPDIELNDLSDADVVECYKMIRDFSKKLTSDECSYWSPRLERDIYITFQENAAELVNSGEAEPFHVCFDGTVSPSGKSIPVLGLFVCEGTVILDYRMGPEWTLEAIEGLFELLKHTTSQLSNYSLKHTGNYFDDEGIFEEVWGIYKNA